MRARRAGDVVGRNTGRNDIERLIEGLEASFDAERLLEDEVVAEDLAHSLRQGRDLADVLVGRPWTVSLDAGRFDVEIVAADHVACSSGRLLIPLGRGVFTPGRGCAPVRSEATLRRALTRATRTPTTATVVTDDRCVDGALMAVGEDYLELTTGAGRALVPLVAVRSIRLSRGGSADAS